MLTQRASRDAIRVLRSAEAKEAFKNFEGDLRLQGDHRLADLGRTHKSHVCAPALQARRGSGALQGAHLTCQRSVDALSIYTCLQENDETVARRIISCEKRRRP